MINSSLKHKIAVLCKDYYVIRTINDLFMFSGCEKSWWKNPADDFGSDRINHVYGWFEGIKSSAPEKIEIIIKAVCESIIENESIPIEDKRQIERLIANSDSSISLEYFSQFKFHPKVKEIAEPLYKDGHYRQAILDVYIALVNEVKNKSGCYDLDNSPLMQRVFSKDNPVLKVSNDKDEQLGFMWLFSGAVMGIRNPKAHKIIPQGDSIRTIEWLTFASVLFRVLDEAEKV